MKAHQTQEYRRLSLTLPNKLFNQVEHLAKQEEKTYTGIVRNALEHWLEYKKAKLMEEGYIAMSNDNLAILEDFKHVDSEVW